MLIQWRTTRRAWHHHVKRAVSHHLMQSWCATRNYVIVYLVIKRAMRQFTRPFALWQENRWDDLYCWCSRYGAAFTYTLTIASAYILNANGFWVVRVHQNVHWRFWYVCKRKRKLHMECRTCQMHYVKIIDWLYWIDSQCHGELPKSFSTRRLWIL